MRAVRSVLACAAAIAAAVPLAGCGADADSGSHRPPSLVEILLPASDFRAGDDHRRLSATEVAAELRDASSRPTPADPECARLLHASRDTPVDDAAGIAVTRGREIRTVHLATRPAADLAALAAPMSGRCANLPLPAETVEGASGALAYTALRAGARDAVLFRQTTTVDGAVASEALIAFAVRGDVTIRLVEVALGRGRAWTPTDEVVFRARLARAVALAEGR